MRKQQDNSYKIIIDILVVLCYNNYIIRETTKALKKRKN